MAIKHNIEDIIRARHILQVLAGYGFGYFLDYLNIEHKVIGGRFLRRVMRIDISSLSPAVRLRRALEELGPTFIKLGQMMSTRPDILPPEIIHELEKLLDRVPGFDFTVVSKEISTELKKPIDELFSYFSPVPIACASLAQVHEAVLLNGEKVIVKVQRPGVERIVREDIDILYRIAHISEKHFKQRMFIDPVKIVDEFKATITREMDFTQEAFNAERFLRQFSGDNNVYIPGIFRELSSKRVVTMEKITGIKITDTAAFAARGLDAKQIAYNGARAVLKQIFIYGFFHADPHPGNIRVLDNNRIAFLDFGMVGRIHSQTRMQLAGMLASAIKKDIAGVRESFIALDIMPDQVDTAGLDLDIENFIERYCDKPLKNINLGQALLELFKIASRRHIKLPHDVFLLGKVLVTIENTGRKLDPDFNMVENVRPFVEELQREKYKPRNIYLKVQKISSAMFRFAQSLPGEMSSILAKIRQGALKIEFEHMGLEQLTNELDRSSNRITFGMIISALIVGSSIMVHSDRGPHYLGLPIFGIVGFSMAAIMGIWLLIIILLYGKR